MSSSVRIALDAMGGDNAPTETVLGAIQAAREYGIGVYLVGREDSIRAELAKHNTTSLDLPIVHTDEVIEMHEHAADAVRRKRNASMAVALQLVRDGKALGAVSAGNSGAMMAASLFILGRIPGIERPALGSIFPNEQRASLVLDVGANTDCKPEYLLQFALMGSVYMERVFHVFSPRVALLSNGEEASKGNKQVVETHQLLRANATTLGINFIGNVEGHDVPAGVADVIVCDGFVGNVMLKLVEGLGEKLLSLIRAQMTNSLLTKLAGAILRPGLRKVFKRLDYAEYGGVPLLGVNGAAIVSHGRSNAKAIKNALRVAQQTAETEVTTAIREGIAKLRSQEGKQEAGV
jgi:glycerol-3-phosphate acyltransferase PlsX